MLEPQMADSLGQLLQFVHDATFILWAAPLVALLANAAKLLPFLNNISAPVIALALQVGVWAVYAVADRSGYGLNFQQWTEAATTILQVLLPLVLSALGSKGVYEVSRRCAVPLFGHART